MGRDLKIYMRGKGVTMLQELLQRMGYSINDRPGLFGVSTRDAVKDFQSKKGVEVTGIADEALLNMLRQNFGSDIPSKKSATTSAINPSQGSVNQQQLDALIRLLMSKGVITEEELQNEMTRPQPARVSQPPLV